jgi:hypothetical protein
MRSALLTRCTLRMGAATVVWHLAALWDCCKKKKKQVSLVPLGHTGTHATHYRLKQCNKKSFASSERSSGIGGGSSVVAMLNMALT